MRPKPNHYWFPVGNAWRCCIKTWMMERIALWIFVTRSSPGRLSGWFIKPAGLSRSPRPYWHHHIDRTMGFEHSWRRLESHRLDRVYGVISVAGVCRGSILLSVGLPTLPRYWTNHRGNNLCNLNTCEQTWTRTVWVTLNCQPLNRGTKWKWRKEISCQEFIMNNVQELN